jgi:hypothetical protein
MLQEILQQELLGNPILSYALTLMAIAIGLITVSNSSRQDHYSATASMGQIVPLRQISTISLVDLVDRSLIPILYVTVFYLSFKI